jgi:hypothetical protein
VHPTNRIQVEHIAKAQHLVNLLSFAEKEQLATEIFSTQPNLLASVLALSRHGVSSVDMDVLLNILFICYESVRASDVQLPQVSESVQELCLARIVGRSKFMEGLSSNMSTKAAEDQVNGHGEKYLLALVIAELQRHDLAGVKTDAEKYLMLAALNLAETIAYVAKDA